MFDNIFSKGLGLDGTHYCDLILSGEFAVAVGFGSAQPAQSIVVAVVSYEDRSFFSNEISGVLQGANYNQSIYTDRSKT